MIFQRLIKILLIFSLALSCQLFLLKNCYASAFAFIPNNSDNNVSVIKVLDNSEFGVINVGSNPYGVAVGGEYFYVSNSADGTVSVISVSYNSLIKTITVGNSPRGIAATSDGSYIYVTNYSDNTLTIIDVLNNSQTDIGVGTGPLGAALSPYGDYLYVTNNSDDSLSIISADSNELFATIGNHHYIEYINDPEEDVAFDGPYGVAVSSDGYYIFIVNNGNNTLSMIFTADIYYQGDEFNWEDYDPDNDEDGPYSLNNTIEVGNDPRCVAMTPDLQYAYVTNYGDDTVSVIALSSYSIFATIPVGNGPYGISITPSGNFAYVVNQLDSTVSVIDIDYDSDNYHTIIATVSVGNSPVGFGSFIGGNPPKAPTNLRATREDTYTIGLTWDDTSEDELGFTIMRKKYITGTYTELVTLDKDVTSYTDTGLEGTSNYYYRVFAFNHAGNSNYSNETYTTTGDESGCFIATAAYGSSSEPHVKTLRAFRDRFLTSNTLGNNFLDFYYKYSPPIARYIENHEILRSIIRWSLLPLAGISRLLLSFGPVKVFSYMILFSILALTLIVYIKRRPKKDLRSSL